MRLVRSQLEIIDTLRRPSEHSSVERKRAYLFIFVYFLGLCAFLGSWFHFISGWVTIIIVQLVQLIMMLIYAFSMNDYSDKSVGAMECERAVNPLMDAFLAIKGLQLLQSFFTSYIVFFIYGAVLAFYAWRVQTGHSYVDAANLWREISRFEKESYVYLLVEAVQLVALLIVMVFSIVRRYSE